MDWLGSIGGIEQILIDLLIFLFGGYAQFNAVICTYKLLSGVKNNFDYGAGECGGHKKDGECDSDLISNLSTCERI